MTTIVMGDGPLELEADARGEHLWVSAPRLASATGWTLKPEGLCKDSVCVPVPAARAAELVADDAIDLAGLWRHLGRPVLHDEAGAIWVLGESAAERSAALRSLEAPDFTLPDLDGTLHSLSDHRGRKVLLCTWASW